MSPAAEGELQYFAVRRGEVTKRADCHYHLPKYRILINKIQKRFPDIQRLDFYSEVICGPFGSEIASAEYQETGIPLVRISNITTEGTIDEEALIFLSEKKANSLNSKQVKPGDLVISQRGTLGIPAVVPSTYPVWNISANLIAIRRVANLDPTYIQLFLSSTLGALQLERNQSGQVQGKIITEDVASVQIPKVKFERALVSQMQTAQETRKKKLKEAEVLLDSIDGYVLAELGIKIPVVEKKKCFAVYANETVGKRVDPHFHQPKYQEFTQSLEAGRYRVTPLSSLITDLKNGVEIRTYSDYGYRYLRVSDLGQHGVENHDLRYVDVAEIPDKIRLTGNSFLISRSGSLGLVSVVEDEIREAILSSHIFKVSLNINQILPKYLEALLRSQIGQTQFFQNNNGGVIPEISQSALKSISVIVPPLDVQERIADEAMERQSKAAELRQEAVKNWEDAKAQFEIQLLSGEVS